MRNVLILSVLVAGSAKNVQVYDICKVFYPDRTKGSGGFSLYESSLTSPNQKQGGLKSARRLKFSDSGKNCEILLYPKSNFRGTPRRYFSNKKYVKPQEKSVRTFGHCCWRLFASSRKRNKNYKILAGNAEYKDASEWNGIPATTKRIQRVENC